MTLIQKNEASLLNKPNTENEHSLGDHPNIENEANPENGAQPTQTNNQLPNLEIDPNYPNQNSPQNTLPNQPNMDINQPSHYEISETICMGTENIVIWIGILVMRTRSIVMGKDNIVMGKGI
ncbi:hypothetical protein ACOSP7_013221 [Xanthoceras sorbifolium]